MTKDEKMRDKHPALNEAWKKYQTLYKLLDDGTVKDEISASRASEILEMIRARRVTT